jgi:hypothetical protein
MSQAADTIEQETGKMEIGIEALEPECHCRCAARLRTDIEDKDHGCVEDFRQFRSTPASLRYSAPS